MYTEGVSLISAEGSKGSCSCMKLLDRNIWRSSISLQTKIRLYNVYILPILLYGADTWSKTMASSRRLDAFDQCCLRRIVHIPYTAHITNEEVRCRTGQSPVTSVIAKRRLRLLGHLARADPSQDHSRILRAACNRPPADWRRRAGRPSRTWLCTIQLDLQPQNWSQHSEDACAGSFKVASACGDGYAH